MGFGLSMHFFGKEMGYLMVLADIAIFTTENLMTILILRI